MWGKRRFNLPRWQVLSVWGQGGVHISARPLGSELSTWTWARRKYLAVTMMAGGVKKQEFAWPGRVQGKENAQSAPVW